MDLIDRQAVLDILRYAWDENGWDTEYGWVRDNVEQLPSAQPEKRTEERTETHECDQISRQAAIDELKREASCGDRDYEKGLNIAADILELLPSAQRTGRWIECYPEGFWKCNKCNFVSEASAADVLYHYCPNCGAHMEV